MESTKVNTSAKLTYNLTQMDDNRLRVVITKDDIEVGSLYYEKAKRSFNRKPIGMNAWTMVDAKIEGLYEAEEMLTPTEVSNKCQQLINEFFNCSPLA